MGNRLKKELNCTEELAQMAVLNRALPVASICHLEQTLAECEYSLPSRQVGLDL